MAAADRIQQYLLDRANIHDTVTKLTLYYDIGTKEDLEAIYTPECIVDFTALFGGEPTRTTNKKWAGNLLHLVQGFDKTQHVVTALLIQLPQPTASSGPTDECTVIAYVNGHLCRQGTESGSLMHNGGRYELDMIRVKELEARGENPWKIAKHKTVPLWVDGNTELNHGRREFVHDVMGEQ